ncbi:DUF6691 family protein [Ekhidna sp. To15]|uniref:DUF6691 family protein n=1 Tax=Ekhidna sp. To15 TaxID=3395267 RepID=UPI003F521001
MKYIKYLVLGTLFGIILTKGEVISWYRIYEMFRFQSFHMYGVLGSAVILGIIITQVIRRTNLKSIYGEPIKIAPKERSVTRYIVGGFLFGLGWALTGACPGPLFILIGNGISVFVVSIAAAILGTYTYGRIKHRLPH